MADGTGSGRTRPGGDGLPVVDPRVLGILGGASLALDSVRSPTLRCCWLRSRLVKAKCVSSITLELND